MSDLVDKSSLKQDDQDELLRKSQPLLGSVTRLGLLPEDASYSIVIHVQQGVPRKVDVTLPLARSRKGAFSGNNK